MKNYFAFCETLEDVKKLYHRLVKENHPDNGGDPEIMKEINVQYEKAFNNLKNTHRKKDGTTWTATPGSKYETNETPEQFRKMVEELLKYDVTVEIIGCFVWVYGDTKPMKDELKKFGFRWHSSKKMWYHKPENYVKFGAEMPMEEIRATYTNFGTYHGHRENNQPEEKENRLQLENVNLYPVRA